MLHTRKVQGNANDTCSGSRHDARRRRRRLGRCGVAVLAVGLAMGAAILWYGRGDRALGVGPPIPPPLPEPGSARPWEAGINVSTYSTVNTRHGNLLTVIPITSWSGVGPGMSMSLYHNAANVNSPLNLTGGMGFDLGPGWTISYSSILIPNDINDPTSITVVADDGHQDVYTWDGDKWVAPPGVRDVLLGDPDPRTGPTYRLKHKDQSYHEYGFPGLDVVRLTKIVDAVGNPTTLTYGDRLQGVTASGRDLVFEFEGGRLATITDPHEGAEEPPGADILYQTRTWTFLYDANGRLNTVADPMTYFIVIGYDTEGRITSIKDKGGSTPYYTYDSDGRLATVTDHAGSPRLTQTIDFEANDPGVIRAYYTDRRGNEWVYHYSPAEAPASYPDADLECIETPQQEYKAFWFDADRNLAGYDDGLWNYWLFTYDDRGNMLTSTDPLDHVQTWTYDQYNNVTSYTDGAGNTVEFKYDLAVAVNKSVRCLFGMNECGVCIGGSNPGSTCGKDADCGEGGTCQPDDEVCLGSYCGPAQEIIPCDSDEDCEEEASCVPNVCLVQQSATYPTLLTRIIEPPDGQGNSAATTTLSYGPVINGLLREVRDPNNVWTHFGYDVWGQLSLYEEGTGGNKVSCEYTSDSAGRLLSSQCSPEGILHYDAIGRPISSECSSNPEGSEDLVPPAGFPPVPPRVNPPPAWMEWRVPPEGWSPRDELLRMEATLTADGGELSRYHSAEYDDLGRMRSSEVETNEYSAESRGFSYDYDWSTGDYWRTGPDGVETYVALDEANRVSYMRRGPAENPLLEATYSYHRNGLLWQVNYGNGTAVTYTYDDAHRLTRIHHKDAAGQTMRRLDYGYTNNDLVSSITEYDAVGLVAVAGFLYDNRGRLIREVRADYENPDGSYDLAYTYDQGGNRLTKVLTLDASNRMQTTYHYDLEDPDLYGSCNNRLMWYETWQVTEGNVQAVGSAVWTDEGKNTRTPAHCDEAKEAQAPRLQTQDSSLVSTTWYYYNEAGNVTRVVTNEAGTDDYSAVWLLYALNQRAVTYAVGETWQWDGNTYQNPTDWHVQWARAFRYDGPRQRYMNATLNPDQLEQGNVVPLSSVWSDYDGDGVYGDFKVGGSPQTVIELGSIELGIGNFSWTGGAPDPATREYYHADMIGTTRFMTNSAGSQVDPAVYTAFGERISGTGHRYGYAGAWGYQAHDEFPFLHVGARYYDPSTGRFLQRDPIGILGGLNVYVYAYSLPTVLVDPDGQWIIGTIIGGIVGGSSEGSRPAYQGRT